jgi:hypothetical protein
LRRLSEIKRNEFAYCAICDEYFIDDLPFFIGSVYCPNECGGALLRNLNLKAMLPKERKELKYNEKWIDGEHPGIFSADHN